MTVTFAKRAVGDAVRSRNQADPRRVIMRIANDRFCYCERSVTRRRYIAINVRFFRGMRDYGYHRFVKKMIASPRTII